MATPAALRCLRGRLGPVGSEPDGDSVRFRPDDPRGFDGLVGAERIRPNAAGSVQLRLEAIDAPETHYAGHAQPMADPAAARLLALAGFADVRREGQRVVQATPSTVPAAILTRGADVNGRPIAFVLVGAELLEEGDVAADAALLHRSLNAELLRAGDAYPTIYTSLAAPLAAVARALAADARARAVGVWSRDETSRFALDDHDSIGPQGALVLPKLFRRCSDFLDDPGGARDLPAWLRAGTERAPRDDEVLLGDGTATRLSELVEQADDVVTSRADLLDITVVER